MILVKYTSVPKLFSFLNSATFLDCVYNTGKMEIKFAVSRTSPILKMGYNGTRAAKLFVVDVYTLSQRSVQHV